MESSCRGEQEKGEILLKLLVIFQFHRIELFQVGRNSKEWCGVSLCEIFNSQCFPGLFTDKNNFFQVKVYSGLFSDCHVQPNVWKDCKGKYYFKFFFFRNSPGDLKYCYF